MTDANEVKINSLNSEIEQFAESLPYWAKYLSSKLLSGTVISDTDIDIAYNFYLEDAGLNLTTEKPAILINCQNKSSDDFKKDLLLSSLQNLKGVNALVGNQKIEFCSQITIVYGINGSGKTGYTRLLKKAFNSRSTEESCPAVKRRGRQVTTVNDLSNTSNRASSFGITGVKLLLGLFEGLHGGL